VLRALGSVEGSKALQIRLTCAAMAPLSFLRLEPSAGEDPPATLLFSWAAGAAGSSFIFGCE